MVEEIKYSRYRRMEHTHRCAICKGALVTVWISGKYVLQCAQGHQQYERKPTLAQECQERERQMQAEKPPLKGITVDDLPW